MNSIDIRESFLKFFEERDHRRVRSSSLIPSRDPTLLFTNAGMVQFKDVFLGSDRREYLRATTAQKCVRAGGKHNDLENVGRTARHHTFFEMLGNFSFGDYFKEEAIPFAWEYLTRIISLPEEKLWVSIFKDDDEAEAIWRKNVGIDPSRIVRLGEKDNFWAMGDTGPCGPCSEIIIDQGEDIGCRRPECALGCDCDRYLELWNLVFMQYNRDSKGHLTPLPSPSIDTGMGLERLAAVVQGKTSNFETDLFLPLIAFIEDVSGVRYGRSERTDVSIKVIADHIRSTIFLVSDGVIPSNEGRGYVLRRIMRRAGRHAYMMGIRNAFLYRAVPVLVSVMGEAYPELGEHEGYSSRMIEQEENRFLSTLESGLGILGDVMADLKKEGKTVIPGETVFRLYDTFGFPLDLSEEMARDEDFTLDMAGFEKLMEKQRDRARAAWVGSGEEGVKGSWIKVMEKIEPTRVDNLVAGNGPVVVTGIVADEREIDSAEAGQDVDIFMNNTPFYGESGGQVGDMGQLRADGIRVSIKSAKRLSDKFIVHHGTVVEGVLLVGQRLQAEVDLHRRAAISRNHTATHLLQSALRKVLGEHVKQSGSLVAPERLRFDFTHLGPLSDEEINRVENMVNGFILANHLLNKQVMPLDKAVDSGAMAIFGEKYADMVTVVSVADVSSELCGGIHVARTGDIGMFKIVTESGVAAGVRRIEAVTGEGALRFIRGEEKIISELASFLKVGRDSLLLKVKKLAEELKETQKRLEKSKASSEGSKFEDILSRSEEINGVKILITGVDGFDINTMRNMVDRFKDLFPDSVSVLTQVAGGKLLIVTGSSGLALKKVHAGHLVGELSRIAGGSGGGRPDFGQAGARQPERRKLVHSEALRIIAESLK